MIRRAGVQFRSEVKGSTGGVKLEQPQAALAGVIDCLDKQMSGFDREGASAPLRSN